MIEIVPLSRLKLDLSVSFTAEVINPCTFDIWLGVKVFFISAIFGSVTFAPGLGGPVVPTGDDMFKLLGD